MDQSPYSPQPAATPPNAAGPSSDEPPAGNLPTPDSGQFNSPTVPANARAKSLPGKLIAIIVAVMVAAALAAGGLYYFMFSPAVKAKQVSTSFMKAITTGDISKAAKYTDGSDTTFLEQSAGQVKGGFRLTNSTGKSGKFYYLYDLTGATAKYVRTVVEKSNGKWQIGSFVYSNNKLSLIPGTATAEPSPVATPATPTTSASKCLVPADFATLWQKTVGTPFTPSEYANVKYGLSNGVFFKADSLEYSVSSSLSEGVIKAYAEFVKQYQDKDFTFEMYGSVATDSQADLNFADQRADKVKQVYLASGGPASKLTLVPSRTVYKYPDNTVNQDSQTASRRVGLSIRTSVACGGNGPTYGTSATGR